MHLPTRSSLGRTGTAALAAVMLAGVLGAQASQAAPSRDLDQVAAQVRDLEMQAGAAHERAEQAKDRLAGIQEKLGTVTNRLERERSEMRVMQSTIEDIARATYAGGGVDPTLQVLLAEDPAEFLAQAAVMDQLQQVQVDQLRGAQTTRLRLAQTEAEISDSEAQAQQARNEMASAEAEVSDRLAAAEAILADLQEEERQRLAELERQRRQQQLDDAREAAALAREQAAAAAAASNDASQDDSSDSGQSSGGSSGGDSGGTVDSGPSQAGGGYTGGSRAATGRAVRPVAGGRSVLVQRQPAELVGLLEAHCRRVGAGRRRTDRVELHPVGPDPTRARLGDPARRPRLLLRQRCAPRGHLRRQRQDGQRLQPE